nr:hypothetical protein [Tanacetum cinerariifolium]
PSYVDLKTITPADRAQSSRVPVPLPNDHYVAVLEYPLMSEEFEAFEPSAEAAALSSSSFRKSYRSSYDTPSSSSPTLLARKRYQVTSELILDTNSEGDELGEEDTKEDESSNANDEKEGLDLDNDGQYLDDEGQGLDDESQVSKDEGLGMEEEEKEAALEVVPSPIASPVATPAATISVDKDQFIEVGAQLELHASILYDHTQLMDALPPTLLADVDRDVRELYTRSGAVKDEIFSQRPVLALEAWTGDVDTRMADMSRARQDNHRLIHDMLVQQTAMQNELQEMRGRVTALE